MTRSKSSKPRKLRPVNLGAAGIDIGSREHYVCAGATHPVRRFGCFTTDLQQMASWLAACEVKTVAMEATGVYWIPAFQVLESAGFEVVLVNAKHLKSVPGRKSDVQDCQWLQHLHECGLLAPSFRPADPIVVLRSYLRQRKTLVREAARHLQRMQKALEQMNVQLHKVVSAIAGETGQAIIGAIVDGERDPGVLADLRNFRVRRSRADYVAALTGDWREEHLFCLRQEWTLYHQLQEHILACESEITRRTASLESVAATDAELPPAKNQKCDTALRRHLYRITAVDLTAIDGMSPPAVLSIIGEVGLDMTRWPSENHFASWLKLCPNNRITGGRARSTSTLPTRNFAADVFRKCAENLARSQTYLGAFYRRMRARKGGAYAVVATARKLARIFYVVLRRKTPYQDLGKDHLDHVHRQRALRSAVKRIRALGYQLDSDQLQPLAEAVR